MSKKQNAIAILTFIAITATARTIMDFVWYFKNTYDNVELVSPWIEVWQLSWLSIDDLQAIKTRLQEQKSINNKVSREISENYSWAIAKLNLEYSEKINDIVASNKFIDDKQKQIDPYIKSNIGETTVYIPLK